MRPRFEGMSKEALAGELESLFDLAPVGYCIIARSGIILAINPAGAALLGATAQKLEGAPFANVASIEDRRAILDHLTRCRLARARVRTELKLREPMRILEIISDPICDADGEVVEIRTSLVDISEQTAQAGRLRSLAQAGERLAASLDFATIIEEAADLAVPEVADLCMVDLETEGGKIERRAVRFADREKQRTLASIIMESATRPGWQTPQASVIRTAQPLLHAEVSRAAGTRLAYEDRHADALGKAEIRSLLVLPLTAHRRTFGALTLAVAESGRRYTTNDLGWAQHLASHVALALENARLYEETQRANHGLRLAEAKASGIVSISADAIIGIDGEQRIVLFNDGAERIFGYGRAEALGAPLEMLIPERFRATHRLHVERFAAGEEGARRMGERGTPIFGRRKSGEEFPADAAISKLAVEGEVLLTVSLRDITEQRRIEKEQLFLADVGLALATSLDSEDTISKIVGLAVRDLADVCIVDLVDDEGRVRREQVQSRDPELAPICDSLKQMRIEGRAQYLTSSALQSRRPILIDPLSPEALASFAGNEEHLRVLRALHPRSVLAVPLLVVGKLVGALALISTDAARTFGRGDIPLAEELARRAALAVENARLYRTARAAIQARDEVLGVVAHDLRGPLATIRMQANLLENVEPPPGSRLGKPADVITRAVGRMNRLVEDLLDVARIEGGNLSVELARRSSSQLVLDALELQRPLMAAARLELRLEISPDLPDVLADRDRMLQVFENLVGNAMKFTKPGGRITAGAARRETEILFWLADTGSGISPEEVPHVFDRYWQARKLRRQGAGLGLAIVKGIVDAHGGHTWVESKVGEGTTFFFTLPRADLATASRVVLVADDEPDARDMLALNLKRVGYEVVTVENGAEALAYLRSHPAPFLIVVDLVMPVMDGWSFLAEKNRDPALAPIPTLVVSGKRDVEERLQAAHATYVAKPIDVDRFIDTVEHLH